MTTDLTAAKAVVETATQERNALLGVIAASTSEVEAKQEAAIRQEKDLKARCMRGAAGDSKRTVSISACFGVSKQRAVGHITGMQCTCRRASETRTWAVHSVHQRMGPTCHVTHCCKLVESNVTATMQTEAEQRAWDRPAVSRTACGRWRPR